MPVVTIQAMPKWALPVIDEDPANPVDPIDPEGPYSAQQQLTYLIGTWMPVITAKAMDRIRYEGNISPSDPNNVFVKFEAMHAKNLNAPDLYIVVAPMWRNHFLGHAASLLSNEITKQLIGKLGVQLSTIKHPSFDIDIDFMNGVGCSVNEKGERTAIW